MHIKSYFRNCLLVLSLILSFKAVAFPFSSNPRLLLWGLGGSEPIGRADGMLPIIESNGRLLFTDIQAKVDDEVEWFAGIGLGYRQLVYNHIFGGYLFLDRNESKNHNAFYILSPGVEALNLPVLNTYWDVRVNSYIPVSARRKTLERFFPSEINSCGINEDCGNVEFRGHQQFGHRFLRFEEVGPGADIEAGLHIVYGAVIYGGGYFYHMEDVKNIRGLEGRIEIPVHNTVSLTMEASYDNLQHGALVSGIKLSLGGSGAHVRTVQDQLYDRVVRNIGTVGTGSGIPIIRRTKDEGLFLVRDNIYFFTNTGGAVFDGTANSGTFENPLSASQFRDSVLFGINTLTPNANLFFNTGVYLIQNGGVPPNDRVSLLYGQSMFGRSFDYKCSAVGEQRPLFLGGINLYQGNNHLDSIRLLNSLATQGTVIALDVMNARNILICNSVIEASLSAPINTLGVTVIALRTDPSEVTIDTSVIKATTNVSGINQADVSTVGIGNVGNDVANDVFIIRDSVISANAQLQAAITQNIQTIGIGSIGSNFLNNKFFIDNSNITATTQFTGGILFSNVNALGIGSGFSNTFSNNSFTINNTIFNVLSDIQGDNVGLNDASGIGVENSGTFINNNFVITDSIFNVRAHSQAVIAAQSNEAYGIRGNNTTFNNNSFTISKSVINALADVDIDVAGINSSFDVHTGTSGVGNVVNITQSVLNTEALVNGSNLGTNTAISLVTGASSVINISDSVANIIARVRGANIGTNTAQAFLGNVNAVNTLFNVTQSP